MFNHRLTRTAAIAVAIAATRCPPRSAEPYDSRLNIDALPAYPTPAVDPPQDLRNPDTRDFAEGRGTSNTVSPAPVRDLRNPDRATSPGAGYLQRPRGRRRQDRAGRRADRDRHRLGGRRDRRRRVAEREH